MAAESARQTVQRAAESVGSEHLTKTELALRTLRERIRTGALAPGQRLYVDDLTRELRMSPTPIREALRMLQADRLIQHQPHHGAVVAKAGPNVINEIYRLRMVLEPMAVELAVANLSAEKVSKVEFLHERLRKAIKRDQTSVLADLNSQWHWTLYEGSGSALLTDFIHRLWDSFPWRTLWALPARRQQAMEEHQVIVSAVHDRDARRAAKAMRAHIESSRQVLLSEK